MTDENATGNSGDRKRLEKGRKRPPPPGTGVALGVCFGAGIGLPLANPVLGIAVGVSFAVAFEMAFRNQRRKGGE